MAMPFTPLHGLPRKDGWLMPHGESQSTLLNMSVGNLYRAAALFLCAKGDVHRFFGEFEELRGIVE